MIYFIQCGTNGPIKIGQTDNGVEQRMAQLQTGCPYELKLLWVYNGEEYTEASIHVNFKHECVRGEWFHPSKKLIYFIKSELCNYHYIETDNGRYLEFIETFKGNDQLGIKTSKKRNIWHNFYFDYEGHGLCIAPCDTKVKLKLYGSD